MASECVFCIDFGSAFTKVALRRSPGKPSELIEYSREQVTQEEINFLVPTLVVEDLRRPEAKYICGAAAVDLKPEAKIVVHRNWKGKLFTEPLQLAAKPAAPAISKSDPLIKLLGSSRFLKLAADMNVSSDRIKALHQLVAAAYLLPVTPAPTAAPPSWNPVVAVAVRFFTHLRELALKSCERLRVPDADAIPCRIAVPALAGSQDAGGIARYKVI